MSEPEDVDQGVLLKGTQGELAGETRGQRIPHTGSQPVR